MLLLLLLLRPIIRCTLYLFLLPVPFLLLLLLQKQEADPALTVLDFSFSDSGWRNP
jgi:ferric iron reductase protein FhuF